MKLYSTLSTRILPLALCGVLSSAVSAANAAEMEPGNNTEGGAEVVPVPSVVALYQITQDDEDWFKITKPKCKRVKVEIVHQGPTSDVVGISLMRASNSSQTLDANGTIGSNSAYVQYESAIEEELLIRVLGSSITDSYTYNLLITCESVNKEKLAKIKKYKKKKKMLEKTLKKKKKRGANKRRLKRLEKQIKDLDKMIKMYEAMLCK